MGTNARKRPERGLVPKFNPIFRPRKPSRKCWKTNTIKLRKAESMRVSDKVNKLDSKSEEEYKSTSCKMFLIPFKNRVKKGNLRNYQAARKLLRKRRRNRNHKINQPYMNHSYKHLFNELVQKRRLTNAMPRRTSAR